MYETRIVKYYKDFIIQKKFHSKIGPFLWKPVHIETGVARVENYDTSRKSIYHFLRYSLFTNIRILIKSHH